MDEECKEVKRLKLEERVEDPSEYNPNIHRANTQRRHIFQNQPRPLVEFMANVQTARPSARYIVPSMDLYRPERLNRSIMGDYWSIYAQLISNSQREKLKFKPNEEEGMIEYFERDVYDEEDKGDYTIILTEIEPRKNLIELYVNSDVEYDDSWAATFYCLCIRGFTNI